MITAAQEAEEILQNGRANMSYYGKAVFCARTLLLYMQPANLAQIFNGLFNMKSEEIKLFRFTATRIQGAKPRVFKVCENFVLFVSLIAKKYKAQ